MLAVNGHAKHRQSLCRVGYGKTALSMDLFFIPRKGGRTPPLQLSCILLVVALSCTFVAQKYQNARHTEKAVRRLFAYKSHATFLGRAAGAKAHSFGELKFPSSQTLLARNGAA